MPHFGYDIGEEMFDDHLHKTWTSHILSDRRRGRSQPDFQRERRLFGRGGEFDELSASDRPEVQHRSGQDRAEAHGLAGRHVKFSS